MAWIGTVTVAKERKGLTGEVLRRRSGSWESKILPWLGVKDTCPLLLLEQYKPGSCHPGGKLSFTLCPGKEGANQA